MKRFSIVLYLTSLFSLLIYSYSQVDLNLTLSGNQLYQSFQHYLTWLGYFNRPLSATIFVIILSLLLISYFIFIQLSQKGQLSTSEIIRLAIVTGAILLLSYPAFSYDIFNYIFDIRILIHHHLNPYQYTAQDFPGDLWTRFMHWTHRTYPYGPTWLPLTAIFYLLGLGKFVPTLISFKLLGVIAYLTCVNFIYKISLSTSKTSNLSTVLFAFNPLVIIESLVSSHLDIVMAALMLLGFWLMLSGKKITGWLSFIFSIGIKYVSMASLPIFYAITRKPKPPHILYTIYSILFSYFITIVIISQRELLPWYFIVPFALTVLVPKSKLVITLMIAITCGTLLRYFPFLYIGDYTPWVLYLRSWLTFAGLIVGGLLPLLLYQNTHVKSV